MLLVIKQAANLTKCCCADESGEAQRPGLPVTAPFGAQAAEENLAQDPEPEQQHTDRAERQPASQSRPADDAKQQNGRAERSVQLQPQGSSEDIDTVPLLQRQ